SRIAFGCQLPDKSGWPSAVCGVGPEGGQSRVAPLPPRPWATAAFEINSIAAAATIENVKLLAIRFILNSPEPGSIPVHSGFTPHPTGSGQSACSALQNRYKPAV